MDLFSCLSPFVFCSFASGSSGNCYYVGKQDEGVIVDVGINRGEDGKLHGDAEPGLPVKLQTPVPGGVGLLTRLALMDNLVEAMNK